MAENEAAMDQVEAKVKVDETPKEETPVKKEEENPAEDTKPTPVAGAMPAVKEEAPAKEEPEKEEKIKEEPMKEEESMEGGEKTGEEVANEAEEGSTKKTRKKKEAPGDQAPRESKRARKSAENFQPENFNIREPGFHKITMIEGRGTRLGDIPNVKESLDAFSNVSTEIAMAHRFLFTYRGRQGKEDFKYRKDQILDFNGYLEPAVEGEDPAVRDELDEKAETKMSVKAYKLTIPELKRLCNLFDVHVQKEGPNVTKDELVDHLLDFLGAPNVEMTKANKKPPPKKGKAKSRKARVEGDDDTAEEESEDDEVPVRNMMPSDKALRKWVRAYVACFNLDKVTTKHAMATASDKFGIDLTPKKARIKEMLTEEI